MKFSETTDTIVALSTPPGVSAIGVVRLSGAHAVEICDSVFRGKKLSQQLSHTLHHGWIMRNEEPIDEVVVGIFRAPNSYTGEDVVEISGHGSPFVLQKIVELLNEKGARLAKPGEFTLRAFLNSKLDLSRAEAVADLLSAGNEAAHRSALQHMRGGFAKEINELRTQLIDFAALIELELDFSEEDVEFADRKKLLDLLWQLQSHITALINSFRLGNVIKHGVNVVIAGRPNAGKSTLLNRLLNEERAIVSEIPGTTRDTIEEVLNIDGILFRLIDTAGIREAEDVIEKMGVERTLEKIQQSGILIYVFDVTALSNDEIQRDIQKLQPQNVPILLVANKTDLLDEKTLKENFKQKDDFISVSSKKGTGIEELKQHLVKIATGNLPAAEGTIVTNARHHDALRRAQHALEKAVEAIKEKRSGELVASDIRTALDALGEITGSVTNEDLLDSIFSRFCIGK